MRPCCPTTRRETRVRTQEVLVVSSWLTTDGGCHLNPNASTTNHSITQCLHQEIIIIIMKASTFTLSSIRRACFRRKTVSQAIAASQSEGDDHVGLRRTLGAMDLILYGVGSSVGAGIYVLVGLGAKIAGPSICLSFLGCGCACILTSFCYAEFASRIPVTGSAFVYAYIAFGELFAWLVGWVSWSKTSLFPYFAIYDWISHHECFFTLPKNLTLGYGFTVSVVARAWGDYLGDFLRQSLIAAGASPLWREMVEYSSSLPLLGTDLPYRCSPLSMLIIYVNTLVLLRGVKDSSRFNNAMTVLNISILLLVILSGILSESIEVENLVPFMPHGPSGVIAGAGLVFFAFIGFDMVASLSEEVVHPEKNMPIGIVGSLVISTLLYFTVALIVVSMAPINVLGETVPIINALQSNSCCSNQELHEAAAEHFCLKSDCYPAFRPWLGKIARFVSVGAVMGLIAGVFTSLMVSGDSIIWWLSPFCTHLTQTMLFQGQPRILYSLARDGLIHPVFAEIDPETQVPRTAIILTGILTALLACFAPMDALANLISLGTLSVFTFVDVGVLFLRLREMTRKFSDNPLHREVDYQHTVSILVVLFTLTTTSCSLFLSHTQWVVTAYILGGLSIFMAGWITILPPTWNVDQHADTDTTRNHEHGYFQSPGAPMLPLLGIACNTFMMGSLPLSSWGLCLVWIAFGVVVYFLYGIHHSTLGHLEDLEGLRLVPLDETEEGQKSHYSSTGPRSGENNSLLSPRSGDKVAYA
eukprot:scaffold630_cov174-Amphora_coffeaeformis.AAC.25